MGLLENLGDDILADATESSTASSKQGCLVFDGEVLNDVQDLSVKIANGGVGESLLYGNAVNNELSRAVAYLLDTYAPLIKVQELWGRPIRAAVGQYGETPGNTLASLRNVTIALTQTTIADSNKIINAVVSARRVQETLLGTNVRDTSVQDAISDSLLELDAVASIQSYALEKHAQDMAHAHQLATTAARVYQDAGLGSANSLGSAISTNQRVNSLANAGRAYSTTAANAVADRQLEKRSGRGQLLGYLAGSLFNTGSSSGGILGSVGGILGNAGGYGGGGSSSILSSIGSFVGGLF